jgi:predicted dehydrogenase
MSKASGSRASRRQFLEESMLAAAAAAMAGLSPFPLRAQETSKSANDVIRLAVIGLRNRGQDHITEFLKCPGVEIAYVCDPDSEILEKSKQRVAEMQGRAPEAVLDLRRVLDDKTVDTVSIATPNHWHALATIWAIQAGKDVYCEKPVCHNVREGRLMVEAARKHDRLCQAGTQRRSEGDLQAAAEYIQSGKLGKVRLARSIVYRERESLGKPGVYQPPKQVDYNLWLGPAQDQPLTRPNFHYDWHWFWNTGNGELANNNIHMVDVCRMLTGAKGLGNSVLAVGGRFNFGDSGETANTQITAHEFDDLAILQETRNLKSERFNPKFTEGWLIECEQGYVAGTTAFDLDGKEIETLRGEGENHFANFIRAIRERKQAALNADIEEGHQSTSLCHVGNISYRLGRTASVAEIGEQLEAAKSRAETVDAFTRMQKHLEGHGVDFAKTPLTLGAPLQINGEQFVDNSTADALLTREYRTPFVISNEV